MHATNLRKVGGAVMCSVGQGPSFSSISARVRNRLESLVMWNMDVYFTAHAAPAWADGRSTSTGRCR